MRSGFPGASQEPLLNTLGHDPASGGAVPASATPVPKPRHWSATSTGDSPPDEPSGTSKAERNFELVMRRCGFPLNSKPAQPGGPTVLPLICGPSGHVGPTPPQAEALGTQNLHQAVEAYSSQGPSPSLDDALEAYYAKRSTTSSGDRKVSALHKKPAIVPPKNYEQRPEIGGPPRPGHRPARRPKGESSHRPAHRPKGESCVSSDYSSDSDRSLCKTRINSLSSSLNKVGAATGLQKPSQTMGDSMNMLELHSKLVALESQQ